MHGQPRFRPLRMDFLGTDAVQRPHPSSPLVAPNSHKYRNAIHRRPFYQRRHVGRAIRHRCYQPSSRFRPVSMENVLSNQMGRHDTLWQRRVILDSLVHFHPAPASNFHFRNSLIDRRKGGRQAMKNSLAGLMAEFVNQEDLLAGR